jgi:isoleucyl-tRNA synthetase
MRCCCDCAAVAIAQHYILAEDRIVQLYPKYGSVGYKGGEVVIVRTFCGMELQGWRYTPLFDHFAERAASGAFQVLVDTFVTADMGTSWLIFLLFFLFALVASFVCFVGIPPSAGTGIVHLAPAFGVDDFRVCVGFGLVTACDVPCPVSPNGIFTAEVREKCVTCVLVAMLLYDHVSVAFSHQVPEFEGMYIKAADDLVCKAIKAKDRLVSKGVIVHAYPFCWRSDTPLIYRAVPSWFVKVEAIKEQIMANNDATSWVPTCIKEKRFHNWLKEARDWAISRNRFWGTPLPIWISEDGLEVVVIGSVAELAERTGVTVTDLHRQVVGFFLFFFCSLLSFFVMKFLVDVTQGEHRSLNDPVCSRQGFVATGARGV